MREALINALLKQAGFAKMPQSQQEFFNMVADNSKFKEDLKKVEDMGIIKRGEDGNFNIIDQDRVKNIVQSYLFKMIGG